MVSAPSSQATINFAPPPEHVEAASICCLKFEKEIVPRLRYNSVRADKKLTPTEHSRITRTFYLIWRLLQETQSQHSSIQEYVARLPPTEVLHIRELAIFMCNMMAAEEHRELARLMGYREDGALTQRMIDLCTSGDAYFAKSGVIGIHQPEYAPLGLGLLLDDFQEDYVEPQVKLYLRYSN
jgi:hypothetical protein